MSVSASACAPADITSTAPPAGQPEIVAQTQTGTEIQTQTTTQTSAESQRPAEPPASTHDSTTETLTGETITPQTFIPADPTPVATATAAAVEAIEPGAWMSVHEAIPLSAPIYPVFARIADGKGVQALPESLRTNPILLLDGRAYQEIAGTLLELGSPADSSAKLDKQALEHTAHCTLTPAELEARPPVRMGGNFRFQTITQLGSDQLELSGNEGTLSCRIPGKRADTITFDDLRRVTGSRAAFGGANTAPVQAAASTFATSLTADMKLEAGPLASDLLVTSELVAALRRNDLKLAVVFRTPIEIPAIQTQFAFGCTPAGFTISQLDTTQLTLAGDGELLEKQVACDLFSSRNASFRLIEAELNAPLDSPNQVGGVLFLTQVTLVRSQVTAKAKKSAAAAPRPAAGMMTRFEFNSQGSGIKTVTRLRITAREEAASSEQNIGELLQSRSEISIRDLQALFGADRVRILAVPTAMSHARALETAATRD